MTQIAPEDWKASDDFKELPEALQKLFRLHASLLTFDYSPEEWQAIRESFRPLNVDQNRVEACCERLRHAARSYFYEVLNGPGRKTEEKWRRKRWAKAHKACAALLSQFMWLSNYEIKNGPPSPPGSEPRKPYSNELHELMKMSILAQKHINIASIDDGY